MNPFSAVYVRSDHQLTLAEVPLPNTGWQFEVGAKFALLLGVPIRDPERELAKLSLKAGTDVIWLSFQSADDAFQFHHWRRGAQLRTLVHGVTAERLWERVKGTPEPWERETLFSADGLHRALKRADAAMRSELERIWRHAELTAGRSIPFLDARATALKLAHFYKLPGWTNPPDA